MYELRHPRAAAPLNSSDSAFGDEFIPDDSPAEILRNQRTAAAMGALALVPNPSLPGLAFACCAAALPLLQTNNTLVAAAVHSLLSVCLPYVVEPKIVSLATKWGEEDRPPLSSVEYGRLQHLLNRVEQLLVFLETPFQIEKYHSFIFSVDVGATESQSMRDQLSAGSDLAFEVVIVSVVQLLFDVIPVRSLLSMQQPDTGAEGLKLAVGAQTFTLLSTVCAMHENFRGSILKIRNDEQIHDDTNENAVKRLFAEQLEVLDSTLFNQIMQLKSMLACATSLASHQLQKSGCGSLMSIVNNVAECIGILDKHSIVTAAQSAICRALPLLLLACCGEGTCDDTERDYCINTVANLILRTVCCSKCDTQSLLVERLYCWIAHSYDIIPNALAMGSGRMNAKDAVVNDISDEMCAELKNRFSISDFEWNMLLVLQPCPSSGRKALSVLASPVLLRAVILLHGQLQANPTNENESFLLLVELICSSLMGDNLSLAQLDEWSTYCLLPLKALEWEQAENEDTGTATKVRTQGTIAFARRLQDHCADSRNPAVSRLFSKIMIAGLFHRNRSVRISSSLRVRRDLLRTSTSADARDADAHGMAAVHFDQRGAELHSYDSFPSSGLLRLVRWPFDGYAVHNRSSTVDGSGLVKAKVPSGKRKGKKVTSALVGGTFSHAELQKLAAIAFGELEHKIKATAMNQMLHMLTGDIHLLTSAHLQWLHGIASGACSYLEEFITFTESRSPLFVSIDTEKLKRSDESSLWLLRESIQLLAFLVLAEPRLRNLATFRRPESDASSQLQLSLLPVLKIFVCSSRINISTEMQLHPAAYETVKLLSTVSAQILSMMACQCEDWTVFPFADECDNIINCTFISTKRSSSDAEESAQVQDVDGSEPRYLVRIPASLVRNFYFASPVDYHSGDSAVYVSPESLAPSAWVTIMASTSFEVVQLECTSADAVVFPPPEIARALEHDAFHPIATER